MKLRSALLVVSAAIFSACGSGSSIPSTIVPNASTSTITVTQSGAPVSGVSVTLSTTVSNTGAPMGTIIATQTTGANGQTTFSGLPSSGMICDSAMITSSSGSATKGHCVEPFPATDTIAF